MVRLRPFGRPSVLSEVSAVPEAAASDSDTSPGDFLGNVASGSCPAAASGT